VPSFLALRVLFLEEYDRIGAAGNRNPTRLERGVFFRWPSIRRRELCFPRIPLEKL
jgi:hypothetical protein